MAFTRFTNLTPLTAKICMASGRTRDKEADPVTLALLKPADEIVVKTAQGVRFEVSDELDRVVLTSELTARNKTNELLITDDDAAAQGRSGPGQSVLVTFVNSLPEEVRITELRTSTSSR